MGHGWHRARDLPGALRRARTLRDRPDDGPGHRPVRARRAGPRVPDHGAAHGHSRAPSPLPTIPLTGAWTGSGDNRPRAFATGSAEDVTVREYRRGDDLRRVHWRSSARTGELMVRREEQPWQSRATLFLDNRLERPPRSRRRLVARGRGVRRGLDRRAPLPARLHGPAGHRRRRGRATPSGTTGPPPRTPLPCWRRSRWSTRRQAPYLRDRLALRGRATPDCWSRCSATSAPEDRPVLTPDAAPRRHPAGHRPRRRRLAAAGRPRRPTSTSATLLDRRSAGGPSVPVPPTGCRRCGRSSAAGPAASSTPARSARAPRRPPGWCPGDGRPQRARRLGRPPGSGQRAHHLDHALRRGAASSPPRAATSTRWSGALALVGAMGVLARWVRLPAAAGRSAPSCLVVLLYANVAWGSSLLPTPDSLRATWSTFEAAIASAREYAAPVPDDGPLGGTAADQRRHAVRRPRRLLRGHPAPGAGGRTAAAD